MSENANIVFDETVIKDFLGGSVKFQVAGEAEIQGKNVKWDNTVKLLVDGKTFPIPARAVKALVHIFTTDKDAIQFLETLKKREAIEIPENSTNY